MVDKKILWQDLLFFRNLRDAPDASIALVDYERHTFYHHIEVSRPNAFGSSIPILLIRA